MANLHGAAAATLTAFSAVAFGTSAQAAANLDLLGAPIPALSSYAGEASITNTIGESGYWQNAYRVGQNTNPAVVKMFAVACPGAGSTPAIFGDLTFPYFSRGAGDAVITNLSSHDVIVRGYPNTAAFSSNPTNGALFEINLGAAPAVPVPGGVTTSPTGAKTTNWIFHADMAAGPALTLVPQQDFLLSVAFHARGTNNQDARVFVRYANGDAAPDDRTYVFDSAYPGTLRTNSQPLAVNLNYRPVGLEIKPADGAVQLRWPAVPGVTLLSAPVLSGDPEQSEWSSLAAATNPVTIPATNTAGFYKLTR